MNCNSLYIGKATHPREIRGADNASLQVLGGLAEVCGSLAHRANSLAISKSGGGSEDRGFRPTVQGERGDAGETSGHGRRRLGAVLH